MKDTTDEFSFRVAPSVVHGVGVFALHDIKKGTRLQLFSEDQPRFIPHDDPMLHKPLAKFLCETYCVQHSEGYYCAQSFAKMDIGWYLNHSKQPNAYHKNYVYYALRDIKEGEEILIDYDLV